MSKKSRNFELAVDKFLSEAVEVAETLRDIFLLIGHTEVDDSMNDDLSEAIIIRTKAIVSKDPKHVDCEELLDILEILNVDDEVYIEFNKIVPLGYYTDIIGDNED